MGVVFEARHRSLGRRVAIKVMHRGISAGTAGGTLEKRFLREARAAAQVRHPHVVDVFDNGVEDGVSYLVMELVEGETLADCIRREGALPLARVVELLLPVVSAVAELHAAQILHRDLKPANILLAHTSAGICPKVADFGVSRYKDGTSGVTSSGVVLGTYPYMAPEQVHANTEATEQIDQWALGVTLYECATGSLPFAGAGPFGLMKEIISGPIVPPSAKNRLLPKAFDDVVLRAMNRDPHARFACVDELGQALLAFAGPSVQARWANEFQAPRSEAVPPGRGRPSRRLWVVAAVGCVGAVATLAWAMQSGSDMFAHRVPSSTERSTPPSDEDTPSDTMPLPFLPPPAPVPVTIAPAALPAAPAAPTEDAPATKRSTAPAPHHPPPRPTSPKASEKGENGAPILDPE
jgi:serine/threonine-protein kinase